VAKKRREERQAERESKRQAKVAAKKEQALDEAKIKLADQSFKESKKQKKQLAKELKKSPPEPVSPVENAPKGEAIRGITRIDERPKQAANTRITSSEVRARVDAEMNRYPKEVSNYDNYTVVEKISPEEVKANISGKNPQTEIAANIAQKSNSYNEVSNSSDIAKEAQKDIDKQSQQIDDEKKVTDVDNALQQEIQKEADQVDPDATPTTRAGYQGYQGSGGTLKEEAEKGKGKYTLDEMATMHKLDAAARKAAAPALAIEKLGIDHYFPPQQDYVTANFTGAYIGSQSMVATGGALMPFGLTDARRRKLEAQAKAKAAQADKFWEIMDTAPQYDEEYKDIVMDELEKYFELSGGDINGLLSGRTKLSREFLKTKERLISRGREIEELSGYANQVIEDATTNDKYVPPSMIKNAYEVRNAMYNLYDYMAGKEGGKYDMQRVKNALRTFENFTPLADESIESMKGQLDKIPLKPQFLESKEAAEKAMEAIYVARTETDYERFIQATREYVDIDRVRNVVQGIYAHHNLFQGETPEEQKKIIQDGIMYMVGHFPDQINVDQVFHDNKKLQWSEQRKKYDLEYAKLQERKDQRKGYYDMLHENMIKNTDLQNKINSIKNDKTLSKAAKKQKLRQAYLDANITPVDGVNGVTGDAISWLDAGQKFDANANSVMLKGVDGKRKTPLQELTYLAQNPAKAKKQIASQLGLSAADASEEYDSRFRELRQIKEQGYVSMAPNTQTTSFAYHDGKKYVPAEEYTGDSDQLHNIVTVGGNSLYSTGDFVTDPKTKAKTPVKTKSNYTYSYSANMGSDIARDKFNSAFREVTDMQHQGKNVTSTTQTEGFQGSGAQNK
jgi:hypothetical protein